MKPLYLYCKVMLLLLLFFFLLTEKKGNLAPLRLKRIMMHASYNCIPSQGPSLQTEISLSLPNHEQSWPPLLGGGFVHDLVRYFLPSPQDLSHSDQPVQSL